MIKEFMMPELFNDEINNSKKAIYPAKVCSKYNILKQASNESSARFEHKIDKMFSILKVFNLHKDLTDKVLDKGQEDFVLCTDIDKKCKRMHKESENFNSKYQACVEEGIEYVLAREDIRDYLLNSTCKDNLSYCIIDNLYEFWSSINNVDIIG